MCQIADLVSAGPFTAIAHGMSAAGHCCAEKKPIFPEDGGGTQPGGPAIGWNSLECSGAEPA